MVHRNRVQGPGLRVRTRWVYFAFIGGVSAFAGALQFGLQLGECGRRSFGEADQLTRVPIDLRDLGGAEFGEQGGANRGRGCGIAVTGCTAALVHSKVDTVVGSARRRCGFTSTTTGPWWVTNR